MSDMYKFDLRIKVVRTSKANYEPSNAVATINAIIQNQVAQWLNDYEVPTNLFSVIYSTPKPGSTEEGSFRCSVPMLLKELILHIMPSHTKKTVLSFAGDDEGTNYKLQYEEVTEHIFSRKGQDRDRSDKRWMLLHMNKNTSLGQRQVFTKALEHFKNWGIHLVQNNEKAFTRVQSEDKEQGKFSYNAWFTIKDTEVPTIKFTPDDAVGLPLDEYNFEGMPGSYSTGPQYMSRPRLPQPYTYPPHVSNDMPASFEQRGMPHPDWGTPYNIPFNPGYGNHYTTPGIPPPTGTRRRKGTKPTPRRNPPRHHPAYRSQTNRNPSSQPAPDHRREDPQHP